MTKKNNRPDTTCQEEPVIQIPRKRAMGWLVIFCFISVWVFFLGILVGRGMAPVQFDVNALQKELADLRKALIQKERLLIQEDKEKLKKRPNLVFPEKVKREPDREAFLSVETAGREKAHAKPPHKTRAVSKVKNRADKPRNKQQSASSIKPEPATTDKKMTIQVASLRDPRVADKMVAALKKKGFPAYKTVHILSENNVWYRVRAGRFASRDESRPMMARLKQEYKGAILLRR